MQEKYEQKIILFEMRVFIFCFSQGVVSREASYSYVFQEANASWPKLEKSIYAGEVRAEDYIVRNASFHFLFLPRCCLQGGFLFLRFPRGQRFMAKTGKAYKCRRSTNRKINCSKCEFSFFVSPKVLSPGRLLILTFSKRPTHHGQN